MGISADVNFSTNKCILLHTGISGHSSHCGNRGKRKKGGVVRGKQKNKKSTNG